MKKTILAIVLTIAATISVSANQFTPAQKQTIAYGKRLKDAQDQLGSKKHFQLIESKTNEDGSNSSIFSVNNQIALTTTADYKGIKSFIFAGRSDGTNQGSITFLFAAVSTVMALDNPYMSQQERLQILNGLGLGANTPVITSKDPLEFNINNYHITSSYQPNIGFLITADRMK